MDISYIFDRFRRLGRASVAAIVALAMLPVILFTSSNTVSAGPTPVFTMFVPFEEEDISQALFEILTNGLTPGPTVTNQITITMAADNTILYWDHWEDGYESDIANAPGGSTTETWGDGDITNGAAPGVTTNAGDVLNGGDVVTIQEDVPIPRVQANQFYDARDKVAATRGIVMTRAGWDTALGTVHAGAVAMSDLSKYGTQFAVPVGENIASNEAFEYTAASIQASADGTVVKIDSDGDGALDLFDFDGDGTFTDFHVLNQGEIAWVNGGMNAGASIETSKPSQVHLLTGDVDSLVAGRWFEVFPEEVLDDEYVAAAQTSDPNNPVSIFVHNPNDYQIDVAVDAVGTASDTTLTIVAGGTVKYNLPNGSGGQFTSPGNNFSAVSATVVDGTETTAHDWGYTLVPASSLTSGIVVGWGDATPDNPPAGAENGSPVWVAPLDATDIHVDYNGDGTVDQIITGVDQFESVKITDPDFDMTGARIFSPTGVLLSAAWGQDPDVADGGVAYDLGTAILPVTSLVVTKTAELVIDVNSDGRVNPGDTLEYTVTGVDAGALQLTDVIVLDDLPSTLQYVPASSTANGVPIADDFTGSTIFPVDEDGVSQATLLPGEAIAVSYRVQLANPFPLFTTTVRNTAIVTSQTESSQATSIVPVEIPDLYIAKTSNATGPLLPGETYSYDIDVANIDITPQTGVEVGDTLPDEVTWVSTSVTRPIDDLSPGGTADADDDFETNTYSANAADWDTPWIETDVLGAAQDPADGDVRIFNDLLSERLRLEAPNSEIRRTFDATDFYKVLLSFDYRRDSLEAGDYASFQISTTGGSVWIELDRFEGVADDAAYQNATYDLTRFSGQELVLRWMTSPTFDLAGDQFFFDNVDIDLTKRIPETVAGTAPPVVYTNGDLLTGESLTVTVTATVDAAIDPTVDEITNVATAFSVQSPTVLESSATDPIARASIGDTVWEDLNGDGVVDPGEPLLAGVEVTLTDGSITLVTTTNALGQYSFDDLDPNTYTVSVTDAVPAGMVPVSDADGGQDETTSVTVGFGEDNTTTDFGYATPVSLGDRVFADLDGNAIEDGLDFGIDGLTVTITGTSPNASHPSGSTTTTVGGTYGFDNLLPGTYDVTVDTSPLSTASYSTTGGSTTTQIMVSGTDVDTVDFGYVLPASIGDLVWHDLNADGIFDVGEPPFVGAEVTITGPGLPVGGVTRLTDANGYYLFSNLDAGTFTVSVALGTGDLPLGYDSSTGSATATVTVAADDIIDTVDFGFYTQASIGDFVFDDINGNGVQDPGEPGLEGVTVTLDDGSTQITTTTGTGVNAGQYDFTGLEPGTYTVTVDASGFDAGTVNTLDSSSPVTVESADDVDTVDFGYLFPATFGDFVFHDLNDNGVFDVGEPGLDGVELTLTSPVLGAPITTTTSGGGNYLFSGLQPGDYTVTIDPSTLPAGYSISTGSTTATATIVSGVNFLDGDFGANTTSDIGDFIFHDLNNDGDFDAGEPALGGVEVTITGGNLPAGGLTDTTDASGNYLFVDLDPGTYTVTVNTATLPAGYEVTAGTDSRSTTLVSDTDDLTLDFGYATTTSIGDFVYDDLNGDSTQNDGAASVVGIENVDVTITGTSPGASHAGGLTIQTDADGGYLFDDLDPGTYTVSIAMTGVLAGAQNTEGGTTQTVTVESDAPDLDVDFGVTYPASIGDLVFDDVNGNGIFDAGDAGIPGVTVTITGANITGSLSDVTDADGLYSFPDLDPGTYTITLTSTDLPTDSVNTLGGTSQTTTITSGNDDDTVDFGFYVPAALGDLVFDDLDGDGVFDVGEPGIDGITITLFTGSSPILANQVSTTTTAGGGVYSFDDLAPGTYTVEIDTVNLATGATLTTTSTFTTTLSSGADDLTLDFGVANPITIGDFVFDDLDGDGVFDAGEPGIDGVDVTITGPSHPGGTTVSTVNGFYEFTGLLPGDYDVVVDAGTAPAGTSASSATTISATYESGDDVDTVDFGFVTPASIGDFVFDDLDGDGVFDVGEPGLAGVTLELTGPGVPAGTTITTTATGAYSFDDLDPGTYTVTVTNVPAGYGNTIGGVGQITTITSGNDDDTLDFGYYQGATIGDFVFDDLDGDGVQDPGEPGLEGVTVTLDDGTTQITTTTGTGANAGQYDFAGLQPGTYTVSITGGLPSGAINTTSGPGPFTVASGDDINVADFGYYSPSTIGDFVWDDLDGDGVQDAGEPGIDGVTLTLTGGNLPAGGVSTDTAGGGAYDFGALAPGTYTVTLDTADLATGAASTTGGFVTTTIVVTSGDDDNDIDFGVANPITIGDFVFDDLDGDGVFDAGEPGIDGVDVTITGPSHPGGTTVSTVNGFYEFTDLLPGDYDVVVDAGTAPAGTSASSATTISATYESGDDVDTVDFGFVTPASIGDFVFDDLDGDGTFDVGEPGLAGVTLELTGPGVPAGTTITTTATGAYSFDDLDPGTYTVTITGAPAGYTSSAGGTSQSTTITSGNDDDTLDFGLFQSASIGDRIFDDLDGDGVQDPGEPGLNNVVVQISGGDLAAPITDTTDSSGNYDFTGLAPGTYTVEILSGLPSGAINTLGGATQTVTVDSGDDENDVDFGYYSPSTIGDFVWDDLNGDGVQDAGEPGIDGVTLTLTGGNLPVGGVSTDTAGGGAYDFGALAPGTYTVTLDTADLATGAASTTGGFVTTTIVVTSGDDENDIDFGVANPSSVGDLVFTDLDGTGTFTAGDSALAGVTVTLTGTNAGGAITPITDVTDASGNYSFDGLLPGDYTVTVSTATGDLDGDEFSTTGGDAQSTTLTSGENDDTLDFGYAEPASIGDQLFHDLNANGVQDPGEPGLADVDITITGAAGASHTGGLTIQTGPTGAYAFTDLLPGSYTITVDSGDADMDIDFVSTTGGDTQTSTIVGGDNVTTVDFGYTLPVSIGDFIFTDTNADGSQTGDTGISGVTVELTGGGLAVPLTDTTDANGAYSFDDLLPGTYTVTVTGGQPAGSFSTTGGNAETTTVTSGNDDLTLDFGYAQPGTIGDQVYVDANANGSFDAGETGIVATVTITGPSYPGGQSFPTAADGTYSVGGLIPGSYDVSVSGLPAGATLTEGSSDYSLVIDSGETDNSADFGFWTPATIGDLVFEDINGDGVRDLTDVGYAGVTLELTGPGVPAGTTVTTDGTGAYSFPGLAPGTYTVTAITTPAGSLNTLGGASQTVTVVSGETNNTLDFAYADPSTLGDFVWDDTNGDGVQDAGEPGISGVDVTLTGTTAGGAITPITVTTGANGEYDFTGLAPGTYSVSIDTADLPAGAASTTGGFTTSGIDVTSGSDTNTVDFGVAAPATLGDLVFEDVDGNGVYDVGTDSLFEGVTVTITGTTPGASFPAGTSVTTGTGANAGEYTLGGLLPGTYSIAVSTGTGDLPGTATSTTGGNTQSLVLSAGETDLTADFGYTVPASIGDQLFVDNNANGVFDAGDDPVADVDVTLTGPGQPVGGTTISTDSNGLYDFTGLTPGSYTVTVDTADADYTAVFGGTEVSTTGGDSQTVVLVSTSNIDTADFGWYETVAVGDFVFDDLNGDGVQDAGEPGLSGVVVQITGGDLAAPITDTTDGSGNYDFSGLTPGTYTVSIISGLPAGSVQTLGDGGITVTLDSGETNNDVDFGAYVPASVGDFVWDDINGDGVQNAGEPGLSGITVTLSGGTLAAPITDTTDGSGNYDFGGLEPGDYTVTVDIADLPNASYSSTTGGDSENVTLESGDDIITVDFGYGAPAAIGDFVFDDLNGDGVQDAGEPGLSGVVVQITGGDLAAPITDTTDGSGNYDFSGLTPGTYTVSIISGLPADSVQTLGDGGITVTLGSNETNNDVDFGAYVPASVGDLVFIDENGNATFNPVSGDAALAGVTVTLTGGDLAAPLTDITDANGLYSFDGLTPGDYTVTLSSGIPADHQSTTGGNSSSITLDSGDDIDTVDFGLAEDIVIGDFIWDDLDADGVQDAGEIGLDGIDVELVDGNGVVIDTATTAAGGAYSFTGVAPSPLDYTVRVVTSTVPIGYTATTPASVTVTATSGDDVLTADFGYATTGAIGDFVFDDLNGDGIQDGGDLGIGGLTVTITGGTLPAGGVTDVTDGNGAYSFTDLDPGTYVVTVSGPAGATATTTGGDTQTVVLQSNQTIDTVDFGYATGASIGDFIWNDLDADGVQDAGEPGLAGVEVMLSGNGVNLSDTTDGNGAYSFTGLAPGEYTVTINNTTIPVGANSGTQLTPTTSVSTTLTVESGDAVDTVDSGYATTATIGDTIFDDLDGDGVLDVAEPGLDGVTVELLDGGGAVVATTTTVNGAYSFTGVAPGDYTVSVDASTLPSADYAQTTAPSVASVTVASDDIDLTVDIGFTRPSSIGDFIWHDLDADGVFDLGEPPLAGITVEVYDGLVLVGSDTTDANGAYSVTGIAPGTYTVQVDPSTVPNGANSGTQMVASPGVPTSTVRTVVSGDDVIDADFAFFTTATIGDTVWHDSNANGVEDDAAPTEAWLDSVDVQLINPLDGSVIATVTTVDGAYSFTGVAPGTYDVQVDPSTLPAGYSSTTGNSPTTLTVESDDVVDNVDFGYAELTGGAIGNEIFDDLDGDGIRQAGEPGIELTVELWRDGVFVESRTTTGGGYNFVNLAPGDYEVRVDPTTVPTGYVATTVGGNTQTYTLLSGDAPVTTADFGYVAPASVGDFVWNDLDADGIQDAGEPGLGGVTVELRDGGGAVIDSAVTASDGSYTLTAGPGDYDVVVLPSSVPDGANSGTQLTATTATSVPVTLTSNETRTDVDFGYTTTASIGDTIFDDLDGDGVQDPGEPGLPNVTVELFDGLTTTTVTTGPNGEYEFDGLTPGDYSVSVDPSTLPTGAFPTTTSAPVDVTVVSDQVVDTVDLGFTTPGTISGELFTDAAADGVQTGDATIDGVVVELLDDAGTVIDTTTTVGGAYTFTGVVPGDYTVRPVLPAGTTLTVPDAGTDDTIDSDVIPATGETGTITMTSGADITDVDAGIFEPATIGDTVFVDLDDDGVQDADEPGLGGVTITVRDDDGNVIGSTTTDPDGAYSVDVIPGTHTVTVGLPAGYAPGTTGDTQTVTITSGSTDNTVDFPAIGSNELTGSVIYDVSNDGSLDADDPGLGGVTVTATWTGPNGPVIYTTTTTPDGSYVFSDLPPGDYDVVVDPTTLPDMIIDPTVDPDAVIDLSTSVTVGSVDVNDIDFGVSGTATLGNNVFLDADADGVLDPDETGVAGATVIATVITSNGVRTYTTVTDENGDYQFENLPAGTYTITVDPTTVPAGMSLSLPEITAVLALNGNDQDIDFPVELVEGPEANNDVDSTPPGTPVVIPVLTNDTFVPGTTITITSVTEPGNGTVTINSDGTVTYTPNPGFTGTDSFDYTICDVDGLNGAGDTAANRSIFCSTATVTVTVPATPTTPGTTPGTTVPGSTPGTVPATPVSTVPGSPSSPSTTTSIPRTGSETGLIQTLGLSILFAGFGLWFLSRRRDDDQDLDPNRITRSNAWPAPGL